MGRSVLERLNDEQLNKYMAYFNKLTQNIEYSDLGTFYQNITDNEQLKNKIKAPLGIQELGRLDVEYLYYLLENNPEDGPYDNRPQLQEEEFNWVTRERVVINYTRTGELNTYLYGKLDEGYLTTLRDYGDIEPWDWEITDKDERDSDLTDEWFEV
jgi:hypothetical protein